MAEVKIENEVSMMSILIHNRKENVPKDITVGSLKTLLLKRINARPHSQINEIDNIKIVAIDNKRSINDSLLGFGLSDNVILKEGDSIGYMWVNHVFHKHCEIFVKVSQTIDDDRNLQFIQCPPDYNDQPYVKGTPVKMRVPPNCTVGDFLSQVWAYIYGYHPKELSTSLWRDGQELDKHLNLYNEALTNKWENFEVKGYVSSYSYVPGIGRIIGATF